MKFENTEVWGFEHALRGMRNPLESWDKSDSDYYSGNICDIQFVIGDNDIELAQKLIRAGEPHRKFLRQIFVSVDITAPLYWWKEFDTYKVGTVANSTSTMHRLASTRITPDCFERDDYEDVNFGTNKEPIFTNEVWEMLLINLENLRIKYNDTQDKRYWKELIRLLPESWLQKRTVTMNYENIFNMVKYRENHKLSEWSKSFIDWARSLPHSDKFIFLK